MEHRTFTPQMSCKRKSINRIFVCLLISVCWFGESVTFGTDANQPAPSSEEPVKPVVRIERSFQRLEEEVKRPLVPYSINGGPPYTHDHVLMGIAFEMEELASKQKEVIPFLEAKFKSAKNPEIEQVLAVALSSTGDTNVLSVLKKMMFSCPLPELRKVAIIIAGVNGLVRFAPEFIELLKDPQRGLTGGTPDFIIRRAALIALTSLGVKCEFTGPEESAEERFEIAVDRPGAAKVIASKLNSKNHEEALASVYALGRLGGEEARNELIKYLSVMDTRRRSNTVVRAAEEVLQTVQRSK